MSQAEYADRPLAVMSPAERHALVLLAEEAGELVQAATKALRFGLESYHPDVPSENNFEQIEREARDVGEALDRLYKAYGHVR